MSINNSPFGQSPKKTLMPLITPSKQDAIIKDYIEGLPVAQIKVKYDIDQRYLNWLDKNYHIKTKKRARFVALFKASEKRQLLELENLEVRAVELLDDDDTPKSLKWEIIKYFYNFKTGAKDTIQQLLVDKRTQNNIQLNISPKELKEAYKVLEDFNKDVENDD